MIAGLKEKSLESNSYGAITDNAADRGKRIGRYKGPWGDLGSCLMKGLGGKFAAGRASRLR